MPEPIDSIFEDVRKTYEYKVGYKEGYVAATKECTKKIRALRERYFGCKKIFNDCDNEEGEE